MTISPTTATTDGTGAVAYTVTVTGSNGFAGTVDLSVSGLPSGATGVLAPPKTAVPGSARLVVRVPAGTAPGTYTFTVAAQSGSLVSTASANLVVTAADFTIAVNPSVRYATAGLAATYEVVTGTQGGVFPSRHGGQAGSYFDKFDVKASESANTSAGKLVMSQ